MNLIERKTILNEISDTFLNKKEQTVLLCSYAGSGKSTIANEYGYSFLSESANNFAYFFNSSEQNLKFSLNEYVKSIPGSKEKPNITVKDILNKIHATFRCLNKRTKLLFILDNCDSYEIIADLLNLNLTNLYFIITTRNDYLLNSKQKYHKIELKPFSPAESLEYLKLNLIVDLTTNQIDLDRLEMRPYLLNKITAFIKLKSASIKDSIDSFTDDTLFELIQNKNKQSFEILKLSAYLDADFIPVKIFLKLLNISKEELELLVKNLKELSLIKIQYEKETGIKLHRCLQNEILQYLKQNQSLDQLGETLTRILPIINDDSTTWSTNRLYYNNFKKIFEIFLAFKDENDLNLIERYAEFNYKWLNYSESLKYFQKALALNKSNSISYLSYIANIHSASNQYDKALDCLNNSLEQLDKDESSNQFATILNNISIIYLDQSDFNKCLEFTNEALNIFKQNNKDEQIAGCLNRIAGVYYEKSDYDLALDYYEQSLDIYHKLYPNDIHPKVADVLNGLGLVYYKKDQLADALKCYEKTINIYKKYYVMKDYKTVSNALNNMAMVYDKQHEYAKALEYYKRSLTLTRDLFEGNDNHDLISITFLNIGTVYMSLCENELALDYFGKALAVCTNIFSHVKYHPRVANIFTNYGLVYLDLKQYEKSLEYFQDAMNICQHVYNNEGEELAEIYNNIAILYLEQLKPTEALEYLYKALNLYNKIFKDENNLKRANVLNNIAAVYVSLDRNEEALEYCKKALGIYECYPNETYSCDLCDILNNIGSVCISLDRFGEGLTHLERALQICTADSGSSKAEVLNNFGYLYFKTRDYDRSVEFFRNAKSIFETLNDGDNVKNTDTLIKFSESFKSLSQILPHDEINQLTKIVLKLMKKREVNQQLEFLNDDSLSEKFRLIFKLLLEEEDDDDDDKEADEQGEDDEEDEDNNNTEL